MKQLFYADAGIHGPGVSQFAWQPAGNYLATAGVNGVMHVFDRHGSRVAEVPLSSRSVCVALDWDASGGVIAVMQRGSSKLHLWELASKRAQTVETGLRGPSFLRWAPHRSLLSIGDSHGTLYLYDHDAGRGETVIGKHSGAIISGAWSSTGQLALGGADKVLSLSNDRGETSEQTEVEGGATHVQFASRKSDVRTGRGGSGRSGGKLKSESTVSVNVEGKSILLLPIDRPEAPVQFDFMEHYGAIVSHEWFGDGYLLVGFARGHVVMLSTEREERQEELFSGQFHKDELRALSFSATLQRAAAAGRALIKVIDVQTHSEMKEDQIRVPEEWGSVHRIEWTPDGQMLTIATEGGCVGVFLAAMPLVADACTSKVAFLSSLRELTVVETFPPPGTPDAAARIALPLEAEPSIVALGPRHAAIALNNRIWFHRLLPPGVEGAGVASRREFLGTVEAISLGAKVAAVLVAGRCHVVPIEGEGEIVLPKRSGGGSGGERGGGGEGAASGGGSGGGGDAGVTCVSVTSHAVLWGGEDGNVHAFHLEVGESPRGCKYRGSHPVPPAGWPVKGVGEEEEEEEREADAIESLWSNAAGTRVFVKHQSGRTAVYCPGDGTSIVLTGHAGAVAARARGVLWDPASWGTLAVFDGASIQPLLLWPHGVDGPRVEAIGEASIDDSGAVQVKPLETGLGAATKPMVLFDGVAVTVAPGGRVDKIRLSSHSDLTAAARGNPDRRPHAIAQALALLRIDMAWETALAMLDDHIAHSASGAAAVLHPDSPVRKCILAVANRAMEALAVNEAAQAHRRLGDVAMVQALERLQDVDEAVLLAGHMAALFGDLDGAQELLLASSQAALAVQLRADVGDWVTAVRLAESLAPEMLPKLLVEHARALEADGEYEEALSAFSRAHALIPAAPSSTASAHVIHLREQIDAGRARTLLRTGDIRGGLALAKSGTQTLASECARILATLNQWREAAALWERAGDAERAARLLLQGKAFSDATRIMARVRAPKLLAGYAKAMEAMGNFEEAADSYERAGETEALVRLLVHKMSKPDRAGEVVRATHNAGAAKILSEWCRSTDDTRGAVEFLVLAGNTSDAFKLAAEHGTMDLYVQVLEGRFGSEKKSGEGKEGEDASERRARSGPGSGSTAAIDPNEYRRIAEYYEAREDWAQAGKFFAAAGDPARALRLLLRGGEPCIPAAIKLVGDTRLEMLSHMLLDYLTGVSDGERKNFMYVFQLYLALRNFKQAAATAVVIARQEMELGELKAAHKVLAEAHAALRTQGVRIPSNLASMLELVHSYHLSKPLLRAGDHVAAAKMLQRVAAQLSKFPTETVPILTLVTVESQRAGFKKTAHSFAVMLMEPERRKQVAPKLLKKIEGLVRRPSDQERAEEETPCPSCGTPFPAWELDCPTCRNHLPMCIASGRHMTLDEWSECPRCHSPAQHSYFLRHITTTADAESGKAPCPLCSESIHPATVRRVDDPAAALQAWFERNRAKLEEDEDEGGDGEDEEEEGGGGGGEGEKPKRGAAAAAAAIGRMG